MSVTIRNGYSDGIDPDCCRNVRIADCRIESRDDAIAAKASFALGVRGSTENVLVTDCALVNVRNALKLGTESIGDFKNIVFRNCTISARGERRKPYPDGWKPQPSAGISLLTVDGGSLERVRVSGITMAGVRAPLFVRVGRRGLGQKVPAAGELTDISIADIVATGATWPSSRESHVREAQIPPDPPIRQVSLASNPLCESIDNTEALLGHRGRGAKTSSSLASPGAPTQRDGRRQQDTRYESHGSVVFTRAAS